jgi:hypothetical protein
MIVRCGRHHQASTSASNGELLTPRSKDINSLFESGTNLQGDKIVGRFIDANGCISQFQLKTVSFRLKYSFLIIVPSPLILNLGTAKKGNQRQFIAKKHHPASKIYENHAKNCIKL